MVHNADHKIMFIKLFLHIYDEFNALIFFYSENFLNFILLWVPEQVLCLIVNDTSFHSSCNQITGYW